MQLKKLRANEVPLIIREKRVIRNLFHSANARLLHSLSPQFSDRILKRHLDKPASHSLALPIAYAKAALVEHLTLQIDPARLTHRLHDWVSLDEDERPRHINDYFLCFADWSPALKPIAKSPVYIEAVQLLETGLDYKLTSAYQRYIKRLEKGVATARNRSPLDTVEKINLYFERFVNLFSSIQRHGFLPLEDARHAAQPLNTASAIRSWRTNYGESDLGIAIGASRELVALPGGQHRLAVALVLKLNSIPVQLRLVHATRFSKDIKDDGSIDPITQIKNSISDLQVSLNRTTDNESRYSPTTHVSADQPSATAA